MIDDYEQAIALVEKMEALLPIAIKIHPDILKQRNSQKDFQNNYIAPDQYLFIEKIIYANDEGGILCLIKKDLEKSQSALYSLTHFSIDEDHPLAEEIQKYQHKRVMKMALRDGKIGKARRLIKQVKKKKGFGNL
jgi:hypothetical protein